MADLLMKMPVPYEPKRKNRFVLTFPSSLGINSWYVESTSRPKSKLIRLTHSILKHIYLRCG